MSKKKEIRIGLIGFGLMCRIYIGNKRIGDFFPEREYRSVLKAFVPEVLIKYRNLQNNETMSQLKQIGKLSLPVMILLFGVGF